MNTLERRISEALRAYGEGLDMTTRDIDRLEQELEPKQEARRKQRRSRIWQAAVAACAVTGVVLGALALRSDPAPPPVPARPPILPTTGLAGIWSYDSWLWTFTEDGKLTYTNQPYDPLVHTDSSGEPGLTYRTTPDGFVVHGSDDCDDVFAATLSLDGRLRATPMGTTGSGCPSAAPSDPGGASGLMELTRVSPVSMAGADLELLWPTEKAIAVSSVRDVEGTWLFPATGTLLAITTSGDYAGRTFATLNRPETGRVAVEGAGSLVFTPDGNPTCTAVFESVTSRNSTVDAKVADESCSRLTGATDTWIRIN